MSEIGFFVFAALLISTAVSAVTITDLRKTGLAFFLLNVTLSSFFLIQDSGLLALAQFLLGATVIAFLLRKNSASERTSGVSMVKSPNGAIGLFILICFTMIITPVWMYSVWKSQPGEAPVGIAESAGKLFALAGGNYAVVFAAAFLMFIVVVVSFWSKSYPAGKSSPRNSQEVT